MDYYDYMRLQYYFVLSLILTCSFGTYAQSPTTADPLSKISALDSQLFYQLLMGELNARSDEPAAAFSLTMDAAYKIKDPVLYRRAVQIALQTRAGESALLAAKAWSEAIPSSREANRFVLQILLSLNRLTETPEPLKREITLAPAKDRRDVIWAIPGSFERASDKQLAVATVQKALSSVIQDPELGDTAWAVVGRMWLSAGDKSSALNAASKGQAVNVRSEHVAILALAMLNSELPQAETMVKKHLAGPARTEFRMAYVKALLRAKRDDDAKSELQSIVSHSPDYAEAWLLQGALAMHSSQFEQAESQFQHYLELESALPNKDQPAELRRGMSQAFLSLAQIAKQRKDLKQADMWLQRVDNPDDVLNAQIIRANLIAQQGKVEEAIALIHGLPESSVTDARVKLVAEVQMLQDYKLYARARGVLEPAVAQNPQDTDLIYDLAMVTEKMGDFAEMERLLRQIIIVKPNDQHAYNALGYSLAEHNIRLPEARQLITKALELAPGDPFITDSLAWAEFRMGNKAEALRLLQGAFKQKPDAEIAAHLGEVLWSLELRQDALNIWREGIKLKPDNETLAETLKRLRVSF